MIQRIFDFWPFNIAQGSDFLGFYFFFCLVGFAATAIAVFGIP